MFQNVFLRCPTRRVHCFLSSHWPSFRFLSFKAFLIPSIQFFFGLSRVLFCFGIHFNAILGNLLSAILWTWPYHVSWFCSISFIIVSSNPICCIIVTFRILSFLDILEDLLRASISVASTRLLLFSVQRGINSGSDHYVVRAQVYLPVRGRTSNTDKHDENHGKFMYLKYNLDSFQHESTHVTLPGAKIQITRQCALVIVSVRLTFIKSLNEKTDNSKHQYFLLTFCLQHEVQFSDVIWKHRSLQIQLFAGKVCRTHCFNFPRGSESYILSVRSYMVRQFNSRNGLVKANFAYVCTNGCCRLRNTLLVKLCTSWDDGATAGNSIENRFPEYLAVIEFNNCPTRCDLFSLLCFCRQLYMFRVLTPIIRSSYNYNYSFWYWLTAMNKICC